MRNLPFISLPVLAIGLLCSACSAPDRTAASLKEGEAVVVHLALSADGSLEAQSIDVEGAEEDDGIDCQQEGEHEGENEGCDATPAAAAREMIVGGLTDSGVAGQVDILGIHIVLSATTEPLPAATYWFDGRYQGDDAFGGQVIKSSDKNRLRLMGALQQVDVASSHAMTVKLFDRDIAVDPTMVLNAVDSLDEAAESDVDCEQEGEHEGDNEGC